MFVMYNLYTHNTIYVIISKQAGKLINKELAKKSFFWSNIYLFKNIYQAFENKKNRENVFKNYLLKCN